MSNETTVNGWVKACEDCAEEVSEHGQLVCEETGDTLCASCYDRRNTVECYTCSATVSREDFDNGDHDGLVDDDGDWICRRHLNRCAWCEGLSFNDNTYSVGSAYVCEDCYENEARNCGTCGEASHVDYLTWSDSRDEYLCEGCAEEETDGVPVEHCPTCRTGNVHFDVLSERYVCTCKAMNLPFVRYRDGVRAVFYPTPAEEVMHVGQIG